MDCYLHDKDFQFDSRLFLMKWMWMLDHLFVQSDFGLWLLPCPSNLPVDFRFCRAASNCNRNSISNAFVFFNQSHFKFLAVRGRQWHHRFSFSVIGRSQQAKYEQSVSMLSIFLSYRDANADSYVALLCGIIVLWRDSAGLSRGSPFRQLQKNCTACHRLFVVYYGLNAINTIEPNWHQAVICLQEFGLLFPCSQQHDHCAR